MRYVAGIDVGTGYTKAVIIDPRLLPSRDSIIGMSLTRTGGELELAARTALQQARALASIDKDSQCYIVATGFGRYSVSFRDIQVTEITSGAKGAHYLFPRSGCLLDIGSQSTRAVSLKANGKVNCFKTNDKCAAGSGSFIVKAARYLQVDLAAIGELSMRATNPQPISSVCAVLAESEIINLISAGAGVEDILHGIHDSLASRAATLLQRAGLSGEITFIGGMAQQRGMVKALEERLRQTVNVPSDCQYVCALGAALLGYQRLF